jgi:hypothetical protein
MGSDHNQRTTRSKKILGKLTGVVMSFAKVTTAGYHHQKAKKGKQTRSLLTLSQTSLNSC